jgi:beta-glucanase (GH16 family)
VLALGAMSNAVLFRDDFSEKVLDKTQWSSATWRLGRTQFGLEPRAENGVLHLSFDTLGFQGTEIYTRQEFERESGLEFRVRARLDHYPSGLVSAFFTYVEDKGQSNEIDLEILSAAVNQRESGVPLLFSTWKNWNPVLHRSGDGLHNDSHIKQLDHFDLDDWHTYTIRWLPEETQWMVDGVTVSSSRLAQPTEKTPFRISFWAPDVAWAEAYSGRLLPVSLPEDREVFEMRIDWVEIRRIR